MKEIQPSEGCPCGTSTSDDACSQRGSEYNSLPGDDDDTSLIEEDGGLSINRILDSD